MVLVWAAIAMAQIFVRTEKASILLEKAFIVVGIVVVLAICLTW